MRFGEGKMALQMTMLHADECATRCSLMAAAPVCHDLVMRLFACLTVQPIDHWECDPDGMAAIREPYCSAEQANTVACLEVEMKASESPPQR
jgi:hypothetical protein